MIEKRSDNLCSKYILPLTGLNASSFGIGNFINSYVNDDNIHVIVELKQLMPAIASHSSYRFNFVRNDIVYAVFEIPVQLRDTVKLFREGKYSEFSEAAKTVIRSRSGLKYKQTINGQLHTARELLALEKHESLRKLLENELGVKISASAELASIPDEKEFMNLQITKELVS